MNTLTLPANSVDNTSSYRPTFKIILTCLFLLLNWHYVEAAVIKKLPIKSFNLHNRTPNNQCPKLEVRGLRIKKVDFYNHNYLIYLSGYVKNVGGADFPSVRKNHKVVFKAKGIPTTTSSFGAIAKGRSVPFEGLIRGNMGGEFTPDIRVKIQLYKLSGKRLNSACNKNATGYKIYSQAEIVISKNEINRAIANYLRNHPQTRKADLVITNAGYGVVDIKNQGAQRAAANKLVMTCKKVGFRGHKGFGCPKAIEKLPFDAGSQGYIFNIPAIAAGQSYRLRVPIRGNLNKIKWKKGRYNFTYLVDAKKQVAESNERNNSKTSYVIGGG